jgi:hypothetical protein
VATETLWILFTSCVTAVCAITFLFTICHLSRLEHHMSETQDAVDAVSAQLGKAKDEIVAKIDDLQAQVDAGETPDLTALRAAAQSLDDVVPDPVPPVEQNP